MRSFTRVWKDRFVIRTITCSSDVVESHPSDTARLGQHDVKPLEHPLALITANGGVAKLLDDLCSHCPSSHLWGVLHFDSVALQWLPTMEFPC